MLLAQLPANIPGKRVKHVPMALGSATQVGDEDRAESPWLCSAHAMATVSIEL